MLNGSSAIKLLRDDAAFEHAFADRRWGTSRLSPRSLTGRLHQQESGRSPATGAGGGGVEEGGMVKGKPVRKRRGLKVMTGDFNRSGQEGICSRRGQVLNLRARA